MVVLIMLAATSTAVTIGLAVALLRTRRRYVEIRTRFAPIIDLQAELATVRAASENAQATAQRDLDRTRSEIETFRAQYASGRTRFDELTKAVASLEENLESIDIGLYRPHFTYTDSESYKGAIEQVRQRQKGRVPPDGIVEAFVSPKTGRVFNNWPDCNAE